ncbi:hypothetical protein M9458_030960, partial [Cirrhinus mrigala]
LRMLTITLPSRLNRCIMPPFRKIPPRTSQSFRSRRRTLTPQQPSLACHSVSPAATRRTSSASTRAP